MNGFDCAVKTNKVPFGLLPWPTGLPAAHGVCLKVLATFSEVQARCHIVIPSGEEAKHVKTK